MTKRQKQKRQYYLKNKTKVNAKAMEYYLKNKHKILRKKRRRQLYKNYGITRAQYYGLLKEQNNCCAICGIHKNNLRIALCVDHCHVTDTVRGLLCQKCNTGIGMFADIASRVLEAYAYLKRPFPVLK